jgi:hypothetical protein
MWAVVLCYLLPTIVIRPPHITARDTVDGKVYTLQAADLHVKNGYRRGKFGGRISFFSKYQLGHCSAINFFYSRF